MAAATAALRCAGMQSRANRCLWVFFLLTVSGHAQQTDWQSVRELPPGRPISIKYGLFFAHDRCVFENATADTLLCHRQLYGSSRLSIPSEVILQRKLLREVRLEHSDASNMSVGALIGGAIGGALGASASGDSKAHSRLALGLLFGAGGAGLGAVTGRGFHIRHPAVIYHH